MSAHVLARLVAAMTSLAAVSSLSVAAGSATTPTAVTPQATDVWASVSAAVLGDTGGHTCGIQLDGSLWCWGENDFGQLGLGDAVDRYKPVQVGAAADWSVVSANSTGTCAVKTGGTMWCWGRDVAEAPLQVGSASDWATVATGGGFQCGLKTDSTLWCWGDNSYGQLGQGDTVDRAAPTQVGGGWRSVSALVSATCAVKTGDTLWCWGDNEAGSLGIGSQERFVPTPSQVGSATDWRQVAGGYVFACGIRAPGTLWCWGDNQLGQLGQGDRGPSRSTPAQVGDDTDWAAVDAGDAHSCAHRSDGTLWCWGGNSYGQLGIGQKGGPVTAPRQVGSLLTWVGVSAGGSHTCSLQTDHTLWCWGDPDHGKLGVGNRTKDTTVPVQVGLPNGPTPVSYSLASVSAVSPTDVWAVGETQRKGIVRTYVEHGDGTTWTQVQSVDPSKRSSSLKAVSARNDHDVWAVGSYTLSGTVHALIEHWDGTRWTYDAAVGRKQALVDLVAVDARSATDVWAVGSTDPEFESPASVALHWDGTGWSSVATDTRRWSVQYATGVTAISADDVWLTGYGRRDEEAGLLPMTQHWDGTSWTLVDVPFKHRFNDRYLQAIDATHEGDVWTVGYGQQSSSSDESLSEHWSGSEWETVLPPSPGGAQGTFLFGVATQASDDVWAVGAFAAFGKSSTLRALILHWDGTEWSQVSAPNPGHRSNTTLTSVSAPSADDAWAVGFFDNGIKRSRLIEHWDGTQWSAVQRG